MDQTHNESWTNPNPNPDPSRTCCSPECSLCCFHPSGNRPLCWSAGCRGPLDSPNLRGDALVQNLKRAFSFLLALEKAAKEEASVPSGPGVGWADAPVQSTHSVLWCLSSESTVHRHTSCFQTAFNAHTVSHLHSFTLRAFQLYRLWHQI